MKRISTTWGKVFEKANLILFNEYPNILNKLGKYEELEQFYLYDEDDSNYEDIFQWYIISDLDAEWLERFCPSIYEDVKWSDIIGHYILAVRHFGTGWDCIGVELEIKDEDVDIFYESYKKTFHDDLPNWVKKDIL